MVAYSADLEAVSVPGLDLDLELDLEMMTFPTLEEWAELREFMDVHVPVVSRVTADNIIQK